MKRSRLLYLVLRYVHQGDDIPLERYCSPLEDLENAFLLRDIGQTPADTSCFSEADRPTAGHTQPFNPQDT